MGGGITTKILTLNSPVRAAVLYAPNSADDADLIARWGYGCIGDIAAGELLETCNSADVLPESLSAQVIAAYKESAQAQRGCARSLRSIIWTSYQSRCRSTSVLPMAITSARLRLSGRIN
jgi:hypothetical protein